MTKRILHVEDQEYIINFTQRMLKHFRNYDVVVATSLEDAKEKAKEDYDLYIIDGNFPSKEKGLPGLCFYEHIKSKEKPCIFFSSEPEMEQKAKEYGIKYLPKPSDFDKIIEAVDEVLKPNIL